MVAALERACRKIGYPKKVRLDNSTQFISRAMDMWACQRCVTLDFSRPGKPTDNAFIEHFNNQRYHETLDYLTPAETYFGSAPATIKQREKIKRQAIEHRQKEWVQLE